MTCRKVQELITPYLDNRLTGEQMLAIQDHLRECSPCSEEYELLREVRLLLRSLRVQQPNKAAEERIMQSLEQRLQSSGPFDSVFSSQDFGSSPAIMFTRGFTAVIHVGPHPGLRNRRFAAVLALSAFGMLVAASPFGMDVSRISARVASRHADLADPNMSLATSPSPVDLSSINIVPNSDPTTPSYAFSGSSSGGRRSKGGTDYQTYSTGTTAQGFSAGSSVMANRPLADLTFASLPEH